MKKNKKNQLFNESLPAKFRLPTEIVGEKIMREYGAMFVAGGVIVPKTVVFKNRSEVARWQNKIETAKANIGGFEIELQTSAMKALQKAIGEAAENSLTITPRGADAARRSYEETIELWASRVDPALIYWTEKGSLTAAQAEKIQSLPPFEQVSEVFKLEAEGIFFSKDLSKSIIYSVAPPGTSQHLAMLALDVREHDDRETREILRRHQWFQTVRSDLPHFTYLGTAENELADYGLKKITDGDRDFWIPDL